MHYDFKWKKELISLKWEGWCHMAQNKYCWRMEEPVFILPEILNVIIDQNKCKPFAALARLSLQRGLL